MTDQAPTYHFEGDEIFALHEGKVIASGTDMPKVESEAVAYLESLKTTREQVAKDQAKKSATHIITPNGVKGEILGRTPTTWGEEITARFEQGRIARFTVHAEHNVQWVTENQKTASANPVEKLASRLESDFERDRASLEARYKELRDIAITAHRHIASGAPYDVEVKLDQIKVAAEHEARQVKEAIDHLDAADAEAFAPPTRDFQVVEQAGVGSGADSSWLDVTTQQMIDEAEGVDFEKELSEGPALFVTDLDNGALADAGVTREMAYSHITSRTAAFQGEEIDDYRDRFVARVEVARRHELAARKETSKKEAAAQQEVQTNAPDEALFM